MASEGTTERSRTAPEEEEACKAGGGGGTVKTGGDTREKNSAPAADVPRCDPLTVDASVDAGTDAILDETPIAKDSSPPVHQEPDELDEILKTCDEGAEETAA